jgi:hypothetical protein
MPTALGSSFYTFLVLKPVEQARLGQLGLLEKVQME